TRFSPSSWATTWSRAGCSSRKTRWSRAWTSERPARLGGFPRPRLRAVGGALGARRGLRGFPRRFRRGLFLRRARAGLSRARRELEPHLAVGAAYQERRERAAFPGDEAVQEVGPAGREQLLNLLALDRPLQDDASGAEIAGARVVDAVLADVGHGLLEHAARAFRARPQRRQAGEIPLFGALARGGPAEVELRAELGGEPHHRGEGLPHPA